MNDSSCYPSSSSYLTLSSFPPLAPISSSSQSSLSIVASPFRSSTVYVLKLVNPRFPAKNEAHILRCATRTECPFVPHLFCSFVDAETGRKAIIMDWICGGTLQDLLEQTGGVKEEDARWWIKGAASGLRWLAEQGYVHRDIKPSNLLIALTPFPHTLITDFGSAAAFEMNTASFSSTPEYIAPEVLSMWEDACCFEEDLLFEPEGDGTGHISSKRYGSEVDLWSLGVVLYELVHGSTPFLADSIEQTYGLIRNVKNSPIPFRSNLMISDQFKSTVRSLLCPAGVRLTVEALLLSPFMNSDEEVEAPLPPISLSLPDPVVFTPFDTMSSTQAVSFSHLFQNSSPGLSILHHSSTKTPISTPTFVSKDIGRDSFTWGPELGPSADRRRSDPIPIELMAIWERTMNLRLDSSELKAQTSQFSELYSSRSTFQTPLRPRSIIPQGEASRALSSAARHTRATSSPLSDLAALLTCVQQSAHKRVSLASAKRRQGFREVDGKSESTLRSGSFIERLSREEREEREDGYERQDHVVEDDLGRKYEDLLLRLAKAEGTIQDVKKLLET